MDNEKLIAAVRDVKALQAKTKEFDTPENEAKLISELAEIGVRVTKKKKKAPDRYRITLQSGSSIEPATLLDLEKLLDKTGKRGK